MIEEIRQRIHEAEIDGHKTAMFHYQVLVHARELINVDAVEFCNAVGVPESYSTEFRKMLSLARIIQEQGSQLVVN